MLLCTTDSAATTVSLRCILPRFCGTQITFCGHLKEQSLFAVRLGNPASCQWPNFDFHEQVMIIYPANKTLEFDILEMLF